MPRSRLPDRVVGVYPDGAGARLVCIVDGRRTTRRYPSRAKAEEAARTLTRELTMEGATVEGLVAQWVGTLEVGRVTQETHTRHLRYLLGQLWDWPLSRLTALPRDTDRIPTPPLLSSHDARLYWAAEGLVYLAPQAALDAH